MDLEWKKDWEKVRRGFRRRPFLAIDPGDHGAAVLIDPCVDPFKPIGIYALAKISPETIAEAMKMTGCDLVVIETQYNRLNPRTALTIAYRKGVLIGKLINAVGPLAVLHVTPSEWQSEVLPGCKGRAELAKGAENVCTELLERQGMKMPALNLADATGVHDALCMGQWFVWNMQEG